jgi:hypothetical protein
MVLKYRRRQFPHQQLVGFLRVIYVERLLRNFLSLNDYIDTLRSTASEYYFDSKEILEKLEQALSPRRSENATQRRAGLWGLGGVG